jgi:quinol monooxygenase YgiN
LGFADTLERGLRVALGAVWGGLGDTSVEGSSAVLALPLRRTARIAKGGSDMWAQLMSWHLKPGKDTGGLREQLQAIEQPDSGLLRTMIMQDQKDPDRFYTLAVFESEEKARESDPRRQEGLQALRVMLADILASPPEFTDLAVVEEWTG